MTRMTQRNIDKTYKTSPRGKRNRLQATSEGRRKKREANNLLKLEKIKEETIKVVKNPSIPKSISGKKESGLEGQLDESLDSFNCLDNPVYSESFVNKKNSEQLVKNFLVWIGCDRPQRVSNKKLNEFFSMEKRNVSFEDFVKTYKSTKKKVKNLKRPSQPSKQRIPPHIKEYEYDEENDELTSVRKLVNEPWSNSFRTTRKARKEYIEWSTKTKLSPQEYKLKFLVQNQRRDQDFSHSNRRAWEEHFYIPRPNNRLPVHESKIYRFRRTGLLRSRYHKRLKVHRLKRFKERPRRQGIIRKFQLASELRGLDEFMNRPKMEDLWKEITGSKELKLESIEEIRAFLDSYLPKEDSDQ